MKRNESKNKTKRKREKRKRDGGTKRKRRRRRRDGARRTRQEPLLGAVPVLCPSPFSWPFSSSISSWFVIFSAFVLFLFDFLLFFFFRPFRAMLFFSSVLLWPCLLLPQCTHDFATSSVSLYSLFLTASSFTPCSFSPCLSFCVFLALFPLFVAAAAAARGDRCNNSWIWFLLLFLLFVDLGFWLAASVCFS